MTYPLTIIIPLFNKELSIKRAITSVLQQSSGVFELIIVDDGSTDNSLAVAEQFDDPRIKIISQKNQGVSQARNTGIKAANSEYLCFLDADDAWHPHFLEEITTLINFNNDAGIYCVRYAEVDEFGQQFIGNLTNISSDFRGQLTDFFISYKENRSLICSSNTCLRKDFLEKIGNFPTQAKLGEDIFVWLSIALIAPVMFSAKLSSLVYRNAENRSHSRVKLVLPYHIQFFLNVSKKSWLEKNTTLKEFLLYNTTIFGLYAVQTGNRKLAVKTACLLSKHSLPHASIVFLGAFLPKKFINILKKLRNKKTLSYEN